MPFIFSQAVSGEENISNSFLSHCKCKEWEERAWWGLIKLTQPPHVIFKIMSFAQKQLLSLNSTCCCSLLPTLCYFRGLTAVYINDDQMWGEVVSVLNIRNQENGEHLPFSSKSGAAQCPSGAGGGVGGVRRCSGLEFPAETQPWKSKSSSRSMFFYFHQKISVNLCDLKL